MGQDRIKIKMLPKGQGFYSVRWWFKKKGIVWNIVPALTDQTKGSAGFAAAWLSQEKVANPVSDKPCGMKVIEAPGRKQMDNADKKKVILR